MLCFVFGCNHQSLKGECKFFRFPKDRLKQWERLCRRKDRNVNSADRICSCHFQDGEKKNGPTIFPWGSGTCFNFEDPNTLSRNIRKKMRGLQSSKVEDQVDEQYAWEVVSTGSAVESDHNYPASYDTLAEQLRQMKMHVEEMEIELKTLKDKTHPFSIDNIIDDEKKMLMYTTLKKDAFNVIDDTLQRFPLTYVDGWTPSAISRRDQLLMTLMKLKLNNPSLDLAQRFCTSSATVHNVIITHIYALHEVFFEGMIQQNMPSLLKCKSSMPASFGDFSCCRLVIDATEVTQDVPGQDMNAQSQTYSSYKNRHTVKSVTGVAPNGALVYVSNLYPGSTSDVAIVERSNMLSQLRPGDMILADKGFTIHKLLQQGVHLNIPPFLKEKGQYTPSEVQLCRKIARSRIHVERVNERIKNFEILSHIPQNLRFLCTKIFQVCSMLVNFQDPMIAEIADRYSNAEDI